MGANTCVHCCKRNECYIYELTPCCCHSFNKGRVNANYCVYRKNLPVRKSKEAMRSVLKKRDSASMASQSTHEANGRSRKALEYSCERKAHIVCKPHLRFAESFDESGGKGAFEMRHSFLYFLSLVRISECLCANFSSTCVRRTQASATAT